MKGNEAAARRIGVALALFSFMLGAAQTTAAPVWPKPPGLVVVWDKNVRFERPPATSNLMAYLAVKVRPLSTRTNPPGARLIFEMYDESPGVAGGKPTPLERWEISPLDVQRLSKKGPKGLEYVVCLPLGAYRRTPRRVGLVTRFRLAKGAEQVNRTTLTIDHSGPKAGTARRR